VNDCCTTVPHPDSSFEALQELVLDWQARLTAGLNRSIKASDETLGHIEEKIARQTRDLERKVAQEVAQRRRSKAHPTAPNAAPSSVV
jgi:hypothetical protein